MAGEVEWGDPPLGKGPGARGRWDDTVAQLRTRPGQWGKLKEGPTASIASATTRFKALFPDCEFVSRATGDGRSAIWGRCKENGDGK